MAKTNKVSQKKWIKGVNAAATKFAQPPGSFPRSSNLVMTKRGGLITCDGSQIITELNGVLHPVADNIGPLTETFLFEPTGIANSYYAIAKDYNTSIGAPTGLVAADGGGGGNLSAGTYQWQVTALDGAGGETTGSNNQSLVLAANHKCNLSWVAVPLAVGYNVYRTIAGGSTKFLVNPAPITTTSYVDNIADTSLGAQLLPNRDTTQVTQFYQLVIPSYGAANIIKTFPADLPVIKDNTGGGAGGGAGPGPGPGGTPTSGQQPPTVAGGVAGTITQLPQIVQFTNKMILALGNGFAPYQSDGTTGGTTALTNSFVASYPTRTNSTPQVTGDLMALAGVLYKATQGGTTAAAPPAFNTALGQTTADGTVIWVSQGPVNAVPAPRGAAHAIVYAGSLWLFNTSPSNTTDNFDGPSCLKMSDLNNPDSWNPLNVAFLDKDDGSQGMGLATFTIAESGIPPTGSLVAFKEFSTFQINGVFGASNLSIQRAQTDMGCVSPRTIQFVPGFGIVRMTHLGIAMFDGVRDRLLSEEIRPYIFGGEPDITPVDWNYIWFSKGCLTANPPMYCCAVPLRNVVKTTSPLTFSGSVQLIGGTGFPAGTYFVMVQGVSADGNTFTNLTGELSFTTFGIHQAIQLVLPANQGFGSWRVLIGSGAGLENQYAVFPGTQTNVQLDGTTVLFSGGATSNFGQMKRILCYDLVLKGWIIIDLPFAISTLKQYRSVGTIPITTMTGFSDGALRRWQMGDVEWDEGAINAGAAIDDVVIALRTPEVFGKDASDRVYFRQLIVQGKGDPSSIQTKTTVNGLTGSTFNTQNLTALPMGGSEFIAYAELGITGIDAHCDITASGVIEIDSVDWLAVVKAIRGRVTV